MGGSSSGFHGHSGRPGHVGGSSPRGGVYARRVGTVSVTGFKDQLNEINGLLKRVPLQHLSWLKEITSDKPRGTKGWIVSNAGNSSLCDSQGVYDPGMGANTAKIHLNPFWGAQPDVLYRLIGMHVYDNSLQAGVRDFFSDPQLLSSLKTKYGWDHDPAHLTGDAYANWIIGEPSQRQVWAQALGKDLNDIFTPEWRQYQLFGEDYSE